MGIRPGLVGLAVFGVLFLAGRYSPLLAPILADAASLLLSFGAFTVAWNLRKTLGDGSLLLLGTAYLFVAALGLLPLALASVPGLFSDADAGLSGRAWAAARLLQGASLLIAPFFVGRPLPGFRTVAALGLVSAALTAGVLTGFVPPLPIQLADADVARAAGQAAFGVLLALAVAAFVWRGFSLQHGTSVLLIGSALAAAASEGLFAAIPVLAMAEGLYETLALSLRVLSFWFVYQALVQAGLLRPGSLVGRRLADSEEKYRSLMDFAGEAIILADESGKLLEANRRAEDLLGYTRRELQELSFEEIHPQSQRVRVRAAFDAIAGQGTGALHDTIVLTKDGRLVPVDVSGAAVFYGGRKVIQGILRDMTDRKKSEDRLRFLSTRDALTGLYNRALYDVEFTRLERGRRFPVSIILADVEGLKSFNDSRGHVAGDRLLRQAAKVFREAFRAEDVVARVGNDEFAALLPQADMAAAASCLQRVKERVAAHASASPGTAFGLALGMATARGGAEMAQAARDAEAELAEAQRAKQANRHAPGAGAAEIGGPAAGEPASSGGGSAGA